MEPYRYHVYVCDQKKPDGVPCCSAKGSIRVIEALRRELGKQGLADEVQVTTCGSLGLCERGPNMVVYPAGVWYSRVQPEDVPEIVAEHFGKGRIVERLVSGDAAALKAEDDYGSGYDLVFLSAICHMLDPDENRALLAKAHRALAPGGRVVIQDFLLDEDKTAPRFAALFALNMLVGTRGGNSYSESEYGGWLRAAGFEEIRRVPLMGPSDLILATRPTVA
jgi:(2Fe-2S) ferredoxin